MEEMNLRPSFHITGGKGWINDPNGLIRFGNEYHAFFQYYPDGVRWGPMHWGHVVSDDLLHWRRLPIALYPGDEGDRSGCFSGSAIESDGKLYLVYTGYTEEDGTIKQVQCLASSDDGITFVKHGVIIGEKELPDKYDARDFRDPKVWKRGETFYCITAAKRKGGNGRVLLFKSKDLFHWEFACDIFKQDSKGYMIECPDFIDRLNLITLCEQGQPREGYTHLNIHSTRWYYGHFDYLSDTFTYQSKGIIDYGFDFYAPQTFQNENVLIGWMNMWDRNNPSEKYGFAGMLTIPRRIEMIDGELFQTPIVHGKLVNRKRDFSHLEDRLKIGYLKLDIEGLNDLSIRLRKKEDQETRFYLKDDEWIFDRSKSGEKIFGVEKDEDSLLEIRRMPLKRRDKCGIVIVSDEFSVEIFVDGRALTSTIYPDRDACNLIIDCNCSKIAYGNYEFEKGEKSNGKKQQKSLRKA